ncbi:hypothetical protein Ancab_036962 [Ancistrocladus abbreviatus]
MISNFRFSTISVIHFKLKLHISATSNLRLTGAAKETGEEPDPSQNTIEFGALMPYSGSTQHPDPDAHLTRSFLSNALKISSKKGSLFEVKQVHSHVIKFGCYNTLSIQNQILHVYVNCNEFGDVGKLFDEMPVRNVVSWNTVICGVAKNGGKSFILSPLVGFGYFRSMLSEMTRPDGLTMNGLLRVCIELNDVLIGRLLHCFVVKLGFGSDCFVGSALVDIYGKYGLLGDARCVFDGIVSRDLVLWNVMVSCYALNCLTEAAFDVFRLMWLEGIKGDEFTFTSILSSCGIMSFSELGKQFQGVIVKLSFDSDVQVASALVDMYAKNRELNDARKAFNEMAVQNVVLWNIMIVGYGQHGEGKEAMKLLVEMFRANLDPDELSLASILSSCGKLSAISEIIHIHSYIIKSGFQDYLSISNALIVAYSKCGSIERASECFSLVQVPDLVTWTSILSAYALHGYAEESVKIFKLMLSTGVKPDNVAFLGVLSACSHVGLLSEGLHYFKSMISDYHIIPDPEHYACIIDLLGRAGLLQEAFNMLTSTPSNLGSDAVGAFFGACRIHGHVKLAEWAAKKLFELEPRSPVNYTLMSNIYASIGHWFDVASVRKRMKNSCNQKLPGCSWIENSGGRSRSSTVGMAVPRSPNSTYSLISTSRKFSSSSSSASSSHSAVKAAVRAFAGVFIACFTPPENDTISSVSSDTRTSGSSGKSRGVYVCSYNSPLKSRPGDVRFTMAQVYEATRNFSPALKIGQGGFGTVYKGTLYDGTIVAVKRAKKVWRRKFCFCSVVYFTSTNARSKVEQAVTPDTVSFPLVPQSVHDTHLGVQFQSEIRTLTQVEHLNLVKFYGYLEENDERILLVEYVPNGNLRDHLDGMSYYLH